MQKLATEEKGSPDTEKGSFGLLEEVLHFCIPLRLLQLPFLRLCLALLRSHHVRREARSEGKRG